VKLCNKGIAFSKFAYFWKRKEEFCRFERFLDKSLRSIPPDRAAALKLIASELFDNIVEHAKGVFPPLVHVKIKSNRQVRLQISYTSTNFDEFEKILDLRQTSPLSSQRSRAIHYSELDERYRGLGLFIVSSLATDIKISRKLVKKIVVHL